MADFEHHNVTSSMPRRLTPPLRLAESRRRSSGNRKELTMNASEQPATRIDADFVVVGAGSAGAVVASRLSENGRYRVVLLEAGGKTHPLSRVPLSYLYFIRNTNGTNWLYSGEPEPATNNRRVAVPRGRMLGGSSCINGATWVRGNPGDFDHWRQLGNRGWSYDDVLPFFKKMERVEGGGEARGKSGPIEITTISRTDTAASKLYESFFAASESVGIKANPDYNGEDQEGIGMAQGSISRRGIRMSTAECYLKPARNRQNLVIKTHAMAQKLLVQNGRCVGVRYALEGGGVEEVYAAREVVVSGGSINSPQLLELSGIGQADRLKALGIEVCRDLPGVGENLQDHYSPRFKYQMARRGVTYNEIVKGLGRLWQGVNWFANGTGLLAMPPGSMRAYFRTDPRLAMPDSFFMVFPFLADAQRKMAKEPGIAIALHQLRPDSRGSIHLKSADYREPPAIRFNFLSASSDRECLLATMRIVRRLMASQPMQWLEPKEILPGPSVQSDAELLDYVYRTAETTYHPAGTCKMGSDEMAVVDDALRVRGIEGLRIADASIMPTVISGNTNAGCIMIGEKCADMVLAAHQGH
jgi:choline dehydrogenase